MASDRSFPQTPIIGAGCVVWRGDEILLIQRGKAPGYGTWSLPGGAQELGETIRETAIREVFEETGCRIGNLVLLDVLDSIVPGEADDRPLYHYTLVDFSADWLEGEPVPGPEELDAAFFSLKAITALEMADWTRQFIAQAARLRGA